MFSLVEEKWLPVRRKSGQLDWVAPHQIADPDIVAFAAGRADFNGALAQLLIGLLQTSTPVNHEGAWEDLLAQPPQEAELRRWFEPHVETFVFDGDKARFMQDFSLSEGTETMIDALLIDAPGNSTIDKNTDHFVKRGTVKAMCPHCAAIALFTLQTNAPAGGAGNRTSLRGGGPLTTLVVAAERGNLWRDLWLNVKPQRVFLRHGGDVRKTDAHFTFPWLADITKIQAPSGETQPLQVHPHHVFWAMPRRIRLDFSDVLTGACDICKRESAQLLHRYISRPQGLNYKGPWLHPFSPYYETKEGLLPVHPQPGGFSYRNWLGWVFGSKQNKKTVQAAAVVEQALAGQNGGEIRLWMFGYDLDNMKARCWYETTFPLYQLGAATPATRENLQALVKNMIEASEQGVFYIRQAVKQAWFGDADARGDLSFIDKAFWDDTEPLFYAQLKKWITLAKADGGIDMDDGATLELHAQAWLNGLRNAAMRLFDGDIVGAASFSQQDPRRIANAYHQLVRNFDGKAIRTILRLPVTEKPEKAGKKGGKATPSPAESKHQSTVQEK